MTIEQIDRMVREANPVPDARALEPVDLSTLRVTQQRSGDMQTQNQIEKDQEPERPKRGLLTGAAAAVLLLIGAIVFFQGRNEAPVADETPVTTQALAEVAAVGVATGFFEAYAAYDVDQATTYLADDADISALGGTLQGWHLSNEFSKAVGFKALLDSCVEGNSTTAGAEVRCTYDYHSFRSDEIGLGPYGDNWYDFTILDGKIVSVKGRFEFMSNGFSAQMWEPFAQWVAENHPDDVLVLYADSSQSLEMRTEESIPLWEQRIQEWAVEVGGTG
jgi:hypothetical protein